jgi:hypothetical protein
MTRIALVALVTLPALALAAMEIYTDLPAWAGRALSECCAATDEHAVGGGWWAEAAVDGTTTVHWDSAISGQLPSESDLAALIRPVLRAECEVAARTGLDAAVLLPTGEMSTIEYIATRTEPVAAAYANRAAWVDWLTERRDDYIGTTLPAITDPGALSPCPSTGYLPFAEWGDQQ